jgi:thiamine kinase-like enzyme
MYKIASDKRQSSLHHGRGLSDWIGEGEENLTGKEKRANIIRVLNNLQERIDSHPKGSEERKKLGLQKLELQNQLNDLSKAMKAENLSVAAKDLGFCFLEVAREQLLPAQFRAILAAARRLLEEKSKQSEKISEMLGQ